LLFGHARRMPVGGDSRSCSPGRGVPVLARRVCSEPRALVGDERPGGVARGDDVDPPPRPVTRCWCGCHDVGAMGSGDEMDLAATGRPRGRPGAPRTSAPADAEWLSWEQAAERVGCPVSTIDWHTRTGRILSRPWAGGRPTVEAASLEEFQTWWCEREDRRAATSERRALYRDRHARQRRRVAAAVAQGRLAVESGPPSEGSWVSLTDAADRLGCSTSTVSSRIRDGRLVGVRRGSRTWVEETSLTDLVEAEAQWVSWSQAADLVGCSRGVIATAVRQGRIEQRDVPRALPSLKRSSVEAFKAEYVSQVRDREETARARAAAAAERQVALGPPDDGHVWLDVATTALVLGVSRSRVAQLAATDRLPHWRSNTGRRWFRRDHVELVAAARARLRSR
jgi:hypothetical protein